MDPMPGASIANATGQSMQDIAAVQTGLQDAHDLHHLPWHEYLVIAITALICAAFVLCSLLCKSTKTERSARNLQKQDSSLLRDDLNSLEDFVDTNFEQVRFLTRSWLQLCFNRLWQKKTCDNIVVSEMSSDREWLNAEPFALGESRKVQAMTFALWRFLFPKNKRDVLFCCFLSAILGLQPALSTELEASMIGSIKDTIDSPPDPNLAYSRSSYFSMLMFGTGAFMIRLIQNRCFFELQKNLPGASVRHELRQGLQRQFLKMDEHKASEWPIARCSAMLTYDVDNVVLNSWLSAFEIVRQTIVVLTLLVVVLCNSQKSRGLLVICTASTAFLFIGSFADMRFRQSNMLDLQARKRQSFHAYMAISGLQISQSREINPTYFSELELARNTSYSQAFCSKAEQIYSKHSIHYYYAQLVLTSASHEVALLVRLVVISVIGRAAYEGNVSVEEAIKVIYSMEALANVIKEFVGLWLRLSEGSPSLVGISELLISRESTEVSSTEIGKRMCDWETVSDTV
eukprot:CAMPEP_0197705482 /NCGR_PEP_ID=MMETSP1338-20131121/126466_1 /TAXON_ID=43686 ORGANISM="Pelagodinium beii, Strain RCC1491" /NCGR_SAMPLE_ID=MMETSP1338 /ASSEMBLY_ACC=CAM_ASM_000754 /LENGTH=515 /DNA_ID=CAMNT_0043289391 /DNA_START=20 /DNA_END=1567 /DNA_ORIENTATION=-